MTVKEKVIKAVQDLPENSSMDEVMETLYLLFKVERGIQQADAGQLLSQQQVKERMRKWLE